MKKNKILFLFLTTALFTGCSENGFLFRSGSLYDEMEEKAVYYVGEPYKIKGVLYTPKEDMSYSEKGISTWYSRDTQNRLTTNGEIFDDEKMTAAHKTLPLPSLVRITNLENGNTAIVRVNDRGPSVNNRLIDVSRKTAEALEMPETGTTLVQVDILPNESRRLKESLEEYIDSEIKDNDDIIPVGEATPIYTPDDRYSEPIYNGKPLVDSSQISVEVESIPGVVTEEQPKLTENESEKVNQTPNGTWKIQVGVFGQTANADRAVQTLGKIAPVSTVKKGQLTTVYVGPFQTEQEARLVLDRVRQSGYSDAWVKNVK